jgi:carbamate kinase
MLQQVLGNELAQLGSDRVVASVVTQVVVDADDPAFRLPTKPIGPFYSWSDAGRLQRTHGWAMREDSGRGYRRVVASPEPREIVETAAIRALVAAGAVVIAAGGGGIPVTRAVDGSLRGVDAVVDKDRAAALLGTLLGCRAFVILTEVPEVFVRYGEPDAAPLGHVSAAEMAQYIAGGEFPAGSMGPKVEAALRFLDGGGEEVLITNPESLEAALAHEAGTRITLAGEPAAARGGP